jgi:hypothetical protein
MEFTVELRYQSGSQTVLSIDADSADQALEEVRDQRRLLVGIQITAPSELRNEVDERREPSRGPNHIHRRVPVQHRPSRRHR